MEVRAIPEGYRTITPYLTVKGAKNLIKFLEKAFGAKNLRQSVRPDGSIANAEVLIGDSMIMVADGTETWQSSPTSIYMYVENCDEVYRKAVETGGEPLMEPQNMYYGDRHAGVKDFCGNSWWIGTHIEDVSDEEIQNRAEEQTA
jgi:PhnB protein